MSQVLPIGFFGYPSNPATIGETIRTAVSEINNGSVARIRTWEDLRVGGRVIIRDILSAIDDSHFFCIDLTGLNLNVMFELGYAIARNKVIFPILDNSFATHRTMFEQLRILTTVGYVPYQNSRQIVEGFYREQPYQSNAETLFEQIVQPSFQPGAEEKLLYLKSRVETEASVRLTRRIYRSPIPQTIDDPQEVAVQYLAWYGSNIYTALGVICHLMHPDREGAALHNARYALVAGITVGMDKPLRMLTEGDYLAPLDYREVLIQYRTAADAVTRLEEWLSPLEQSWLERQSTRQGYMAALTLATELQNLQIGEPIAENEAEKLVDYYFIETVAYREALEGKQTVFVGRKGTGKSANFIKLANELEADRRNLVVSIKPIAYELQGITDLLSRYRERDNKTYAVESLWKFLLLSEVANVVARMIRERQVPMDEDEVALMTLMERDDAMLSRDFSVRLERCVEALHTAQQSRSGERNIEQDQLSISEALHEGIYTELRILLGKILSNKKRVAILVDNLDKAWDRTSDLTNLAEFFLGLLSAAKRLTMDFRRDDSRRDAVYVTVAIFLRSDIFYKIKNVAREPDKINSYRLSWDDPELLLRVIEERFVALHAGNIQPDEMWTRYFCETVKGNPTKQYLLERILPRPRDFVYLIKAAISTAINRRHPRVEEGDILDAEKQYSQFAVESLLVENDLPVGSLEAIIYEFIGNPPFLTYEQVRDSLIMVGVAAERIEEAIDGLCTLRFLGVEVSDGEYRFSDDPQEFRRVQVLSRKLGERRGTPSQYMINPAYWAFIEVAES
jgi:hypothetical protein